MGNVLLKLDEERNRMTLEEFYNLDLPKGTLAELIDGEIYYMASPRTIHQTISGELYFLIKNYIRTNNGKCRIFAAPYDVQIKDDTPTVLIPDISVICNPDKITDKRCVGAPDWVIEIVSPSDPGHDYIRKVGLYMNGGVREYWIVDPMKKVIITYRTTDSGFDTTIYSFRDKIKVGIYEDLVIDFAEVDDVISTLPI